MDWLINALIGQLRDWLTHNWFIDLIYNVNKKTWAQFAKLQWILTAIRFYDVFVNEYIYLLS